MALDEHTRQRIRGIATGSIPPETGMERHFRRVCIGEATPLTAEEREWHDFILGGSSVSHGDGQPAQALERERMARRQAEQRLANVAQELAQMQRELQAEKAGSQRLLELTAQLNQEKQSLRQSRMDAREEADRLRNLVSRREQQLIDLGAKLAALEGPKPTAAAAPPPVFATPDAPNDVGNICPVCQGDGGVRGGCYKCDGTGWYKAKPQG